MGAPKASRYLEFHSANGLYMLKSIYFHNSVRTCSLSSESVSVFACTDCAWSIGKRTVCYTPTEILFPVNQPMLTHSAINRTDSPTLSLLFQSFIYIFQSIFFCYDFIPIDVITYCTWFQIYWRLFGLDISPDISCVLGTVPIISF